MSPGRKTIIILLLFCFALEGARVYSYSEDSNRITCTYIDTDGFLQNHQKKKEQCLEAIDLADDWWLLHRIIYIPQNDHVIPLPRRSANRILA